MTRGRFAPSPTGPLHLGLARTALLAWLAARAEGGTFLLRVEDLDGPRVVKGAAEAQMADLRWLGLDWDEGPDVGGPHAPYVQSARTDRYERAIEALKRAGRIYRCTCSRQEIAHASAPHGPSEYGAIYPGTCRTTPSHPERTSAALRFRVPDALPSFVDCVHGPVRTHGPRGDFVVQRADGVFNYQLAVVVDDVAMEIDQVVRGDDLLGCTGWQLALYEALGAKRPRYGHVPLLLSNDGTRLAKRDGAASVAALRERGCRPERLVGALAASAGLVPTGSELSARELISQFAFDRLRTSPTQLPPEEIC